MDIQELNQMFDRLSPTPEQEDTLLNALQHPERRRTPMRMRRVCAAVLAAAALLAGVCTAAVTSDLDTRLLDYFGAAPEDEKVVDLLSADAMPVDVTITDNGATLHVTQVLQDRYSLLVLADFTAPEGTVLEEKRDSELFFGFDSNWRPIYFWDEDGNNVISPGLTRSQEILDDGNPQDNHLSVLYFINLYQTGAANLSDVAKLWLPMANLAYYDRDVEDRVTIYPGNWSCEIPLPQWDSGWSQRLSAIELNGENVTVPGELYLSPITLQFSLDWFGRTQRELPIGVECAAEVITRDGRTIALQFLSSSGMPERYNAFRLSEIADPAELQGGTLTIRTGEETCKISLDNLTPVEP